MFGKRAEHFAKDDCVRSTARLGGMSIPHLRRLSGCDANDSGNSVSLTNDDVYCLGMVTGCLRKEQRLGLGDVDPNLLDRWVPVLPRDKVVPLEWVGHRIVKEAIYLSNARPQIVHAFLPLMHTRRVLEPLTD